MTNQVRVYLAGEHEGISNEARQEAWEEIFRDKVKQLATLFNVGKRYTYSSSEDILYKMFKRRETSNRNTDIMGYDYRSYMVDILYMFLQAAGEGNGTIKGDVLLRDFRHYFWRMKQMVFRVQIVTPDPLTVEGIINERLGKLKTVYPNYVVDEFDIRIDIIQPIDKEMVEIEEGLGHIKAIEGAE